MAEDVAMTELTSRLSVPCRGSSRQAEPHGGAGATPSASPEELFLERIRVLEAEHKIRKMGAVLRHREVGFASNVLVAWQVEPPERLDEVAAKMAKSPSVSHCYDRNTAPDWPYNLYTMVHGHSREECEAIVKRLSEETGVTKRAMLYSKKEWKKTSMRYFTD